MIFTCELLDGSHNEGPGFMLCQLAAAGLKLRFNPAAAN
jgi:hypothetical protein